MCYHENSVSLLSDLETDRCNNENKRLLHKYYIMLTIHEPFEFFSMHVKEKTITCTTSSKVTKLQQASQA